LRLRNVDHEVDVCAEVELQRSPDDDGEFEHFDGQPDGGDDPFVGIPFRHRQQLGFARLSSESCDGLTVFFGFSGAGIASVDAGCAGIVLQMWTIQNIATTKLARWGHSADSTTIPFRLRLEEKYPQVGESRDARGKPPEAAPAVFLRHDTSHDRSNLFVSSQPGDIQDQGNARTIP
jgi:hypothetical protein